MTFYHLEALTTRTATVLVDLWRKLRPYAPMHGLFPSYFGRRHDNSCLEDVKHGLSSSKGCRTDREEGRAPFAHDLIPKHFWVTSSRDLVNNKLGK